MGRIGPLVEGEARTLSSAALTRVFSHLHLRDPDANLDELLEPVDDERYAVAAAAVSGQVEALMQRFDAFTPVPSTSGAGEGDATQEGRLLRVSAVSRDDWLAAPFLLKLLQHVMCLVEAFKFLFDILRTICLVIFALRFCNLLPICFMFYIGRARSRTYLSRRWVVRRPGRAQGVRGYVAS